VAGRLRITASSSFAQQHAWPRQVAAFLLLHPQTQVEVLVAEHALNLVEERIDLALRLGDQLDPALIAAASGRLPFGAARGAGLSAAGGRPRGRWRT